ncbi:hypothetical protein KORDIASMS9_01285 [Kordia sp. SMS9]|nr:hypothetical protein KORDIASMS9_01285 [Kordia sp. SMS9]
MFGILLFPYLEHFITYYSDQLSFFFSFIVYASLLLIFFSIYFFLIRMPIFKKMDADNFVFNSIYFLMNLLFLTVIVITGLNILTPLWVFVILIGFEVGEIIHEKFERQHNVDNEKSESS